MTEKLSSPADGLSFTDNISIAWTRVDLAPDHAHLALINESNESFLRTVSAIDEFCTDNLEDDAGVSQEIVRLDLKVSLLLDLVSQLIYKQLEIPKMAMVTISSSEIAWQCSNGPEPGQLIFIEVYIQRGTPKPLCFYGKVVGDEQECNSGRVRAQYFGLSGSAQSWLDKLIFRHHRRAVAYKKSTHTNDEGLK